MGSPSGRVVVVTGAGSGIGRAIARRFGRDGDRQPLTCFPHIEAALALFRNDRGG